MIKNIFYSLLTLSVLLQCGSPKAPKEAVSVEQETISETEKVASRPYILFFGNSITAGYQLDISDAFPALIQNKLDSLGYTYQVINAGLSGETTAGGLNRIDWVLKTVPDIFVLELGANDGLRGLDLKETEKNLIAIIDKVKKENPEVKILLAGMRVPPNLGISYVREFANVFPKVVDATGASLIPFLLEGVAGDPTLNLDDGIHPTEKGHKILSQTVWEKLKPLLEENKNL